jgi:anti-sigma regulatory factor (Ser/Thr protein kinase)
VQAFRHEAVFYDGDDGFIPATLPFISEGVDAGDAVLVAVSEPKIRALKEELDGDSDRVGFLDMEELGRNPACIIPAWREFVDRSSAEGRRARGVGEPVWPERSDAELVECHHHESLLNLAFAGPPDWQLICPYDVAGLEDEVLDAACQSHPLVSDAKGPAEPSGAYVEPVAEPGPFSGELPEPRGKPREIGFEGGDLGVVRQFITMCSQQAGLDPERQMDFLLAANEAATNSVRHGGGHGTLRIWRENGTLLCDVRDKGRIEEPLVGRLQPVPEQTGGRGVWIANQVCDLVQIRSGEQGTTVRLHMRAAA